MRWWISLTMSSNERSSARLAVTSWNSVSITARRSPSSVTSAPVVVLMVRMLHPKALHGARLVGVDLDEVLRAGQGQHRLDPLLDAGQFETTSGAAHLTIEIHQAADRGAVDVGHRRQVDQDVAVPRRHKCGNRPGEISK